MPTKSNNTGGQGGKRPGAGRKKSPVKEKAENGNPGGRKLEVLDIPEMEGVEMPKPHDFLSAEQRDGRLLYIAYGKDGKYILDGDRCIICQSNADTEKLREIYASAEVNPLGDWTGGSDSSCHVLLFCKQTYH